MSHSASRAMCVAAINLGCAFPLICHAEPREVTLPMLEVPDGMGKSGQVISGQVIPGQGIRRLDRSALLKKPFELSDADRRIVAREQAAWRRLSGSLCSGCGETQRVRKVDYVDPIAVLNAKPASWRPTVVATRTVQPSRVHRVQLAHRHRHRSRLYAYFSRFRYALLKWRRHHHHRVRLVQR